MTAGGGADLSAALAALPGRRMERVLVRCVPQLAFMAGSPPRHLYTSGHAGRCNPAGIACLYASETEATANLEFLQLLRGTGAEYQPKLTFSLRIRLAKIVDCEEEPIRRALSLGERDFHGPWRMAASPTLLQRWGAAISGQRVVTAVRYPSAAAHAAGESGWNVAIFPAALVPPDSVAILAAADRLLEVLP